MGGVVLVEEDSEVEGELSTSVLYTHLHLESGKTTVKAGKNGELWFPVYGVSITEQEFTSMSPEEKARCLVELPPTRKYWHFPANLRSPVIHGEKFRGGTLANGFIVASRDSPPPNSVLTVELPDSESVAASGHSSKMVGEPCMFWLKTTQKTQQGFRLVVPSVAPLSIPEHEEQLRKAEAARAGSKSSGSKVPRALTDLNPYNAPPLREIQGTPGEQGAVLCAHVADLAGVGHMLVEAADVGNHHLVGLRQEFSLRLGILSDRLMKLHEGQLETRRVLREDLLETRKMLQKHFEVKEARALDLVDDRTPREEESAAEECMSSAGEEKETP